MAPAAALHPRVELRRGELRAGRGRDALCVGDHRCPDRRAAEDQHGRLAAAENLRDLPDDMRRDLAGRRDRQRRAFDAAVVPAGVGRRDQGRDLAVRDSRRLHGGCGVGADGRDRLHHARPRRQAAGPAFGVGRQRRVERAMMGRLVAHHVENRRLRAPRVVQIGKSVAQARPAMQQGDRRFLRSSARSHGRAGRDALEQAKHAMHAGTRSSAATKCISLVPGLAKQVLTPDASSVRTRVSAPFNAEIPCLWDCIGEST